MPPSAPDTQLRDSLNQWADEIGAKALHERLSVLDPKAAEIIDYRNLRRTVRALEVILKTGERFSDMRRKQECRYRPFILGLTRPRDALYQRVDQRINSMLAQGLVEEVQGLLDQGYSPELPTMSAIGYGEIIQFLQGKMNLIEAVELIKRNTRIFVRRQANWFKPDDPRITWFDMGNEVVDKMENFIRDEIKNEEQ